MKPKIERVVELFEQIESSLDLIDEQLDVDDYDGVFEQVEFTREKVLDLKRILEVGQ